MHHLTTRHFPFTAIVGQQPMKTALLCNAINPLVGGVLIRGAKGTSKSTAARALAEVLPDIEVVQGCRFHCHPRDIHMMCDQCLHRFEREGALPSERHPVPFVTLPLGATEDRVAGTVDVASALSTGHVELQPGLLAEAHRGILYVDEVNLLDDHLVNLLLDAAAMGRNIVEREGVSAVHPARFVLIGTMNPEEGELRPQLLDRFGVAVVVETLTDIEQRVRIMELQDAYDRDAERLVSQLAPEQEALQARIARALAHLPHVRVERDMLASAAKRVLAAEVDGHRADVAMIRVATTLAALAGADAVTQAHLDEAAPYVLSHRLRRRPFDAKRRPSPAPEPAEARDPTAGSTSSVGGHNHDHAAPRPQHTAAHDGAVEVAVNLPAASSRGERRGLGGEGAGHRGKKLGHTHDPLVDAPVDVAATLLRAATRLGPERPTAVPEVTPDDVCRARVSAKAQRLVCFVVDASGSMGARSRLAAVRSAAHTLLVQSYVGRHVVSLVLAQGDQASLLTSRSRDPEAVDSQIATVEPCGRTPLAHALALAAEELRRGSDKGLAPVLVVLSDGRANVARKDMGAGDAYADTLAAAAEVAELGADGLVIDTENDFVNFGLGKELAERLGAAYLQTDAPTGDAIVDFVTASPA